MLTSRAFGDTMGTDVATNSFRSALPDLNPTLTIEEDEEGSEDDREEREFVNILLKIKTAKSAIESSRKR